MDPVTLIFAGISAFIIFRLISVMGTRTGHEQNHDLEQVSRRETPADNGQAPLEEPVAPRPVSTNARRLRDGDPDFDEESYLFGARAAYEMIVEAFAAGDLKPVRAFLSESVYSAFAGALEARAQAGHKNDLKFVGIEHAAIVDSQIDDEWLTATTEFTSNQIRVTRDKDGNVVDGDANRIDLVKDRWTFSRKRTSRDPNWILVATGGVE